MRHAYIDDGRPRLNKISNNLQTGRIHYIQITNSPNTSKYKASKALHTSDFTIR